MGGILRLFFPQSPLGGGKEVSYPNGIREYFGKSHHVLEAQGVWSPTMLRLEGTGWVSRDAEPLSQGALHGVQETYTPLSPDLSTYKTQISKYSQSCSLVPKCLWGFYLSPIG